MKKSFIILSLFLSFFSFAQSNFSNGFSDGYKKGYCQNQGIGCMSPIPPIAPIPKIGENMNSYQDGYNRGFEAGLNTQKSSGDNFSRQRYQTSEAKFIDNKMYQPPVDLMMKVLEAKEKQLESYQNENQNVSTNRIKSLSPDNFAIINIYRPKTFVGSCCPVDVIVNGNTICKLKNGGHLQYKVYDLYFTEITIKSAGLASIRIMPQKDGNYYLETKPQFSGFTLQQIKEPVKESDLKEKNKIILADVIF